MDICTYLSVPNERWLAACRAGTWAWETQEDKDFNVGLILQDMEMFCFPFVMQICVCIKKRSFKYCSAKTHIFFTLSLSEKSTVCFMQRLTAVIYVYVCVFSVFSLPRGSCRTAPTLQRNPLAEIWLCMNMNEKVRHRGELGNLMTVQDMTRASTGMYDFLALPLIW